MSARAFLSKDLSSLNKTTTDRLESWRNTYPHLSPARTPQDLIDMVQGRASGTRMQADNKALWSLLSLARSDIDAGRVVLHAMRPLIEASARRCMHIYHTPEDALAAAVESMWYSVRNFPLHRDPQRTLANLRGEFLSRLCGRKSYTETEPAAPQDPHTMEAVATLTQGDDLALELIALGADAGAINQAEVMLLIDIYIDDTPTATEADKLGITRSALRQRQSRAVRKLATWARAHF